MMVPVEPALVGVSLYALSVGLAVGARATVRAIHQGLFRNAGQRADADAQATSLLHRQLTPGQREQLVGCGYIEVPSLTLTGRIYRIPAGGGQVRIFQDSRPVGSLCIAPAGSSYATRRWRAASLAGTARWLSQKSPRSCWLQSPYP